MSRHTVAHYTIYAIDSVLEPPVSLNETSLSFGFSNLIHHLTTYTSNSSTLKWTMYEFKVKLLIIVD